MSTKITEKVVIDAPGGDVVFDGVDFTLMGYIEVHNAASFTLRNCRFYNITPVNPKNYLVKFIGDRPVKLIVERNFFGEFPKTDAGRMYNLFEVNALLKDGSSISKNYYVADSSSPHSFLSIYGAEDNANIYIDRNVYEYSDTNIRLGMKGNPKCNVYVRNNKVLACGDAPYANSWGVLIVQPYGTQTKSFKDTKIVLQGNEYPREQQICMYAGSKDTQFDGTNHPTIIVDGQDITQTVYICHNPT